MSQSIALVKTIQTVLFIRLISPFPFAFSWIYFFIQPSAITSRYGDNHEILVTYPAKEAEEHNPENEKDQVPCPDQSEP